MSIIHPIIADDNYIGPPIWLSGLVVVMVVSDKPIKQVRAAITANPKKYFTKVHSNSSAITACFSLYDITQYCAFPLKETAA